MTAHAVVRQEVPASVEATFDLVHDYPRRLTWDTLLREAYTVGGVAPAQGVEAVCSARWRLGGLSFRTRYVTFRRPDLAAVALVNRPPLFASWAASIRHRPLGEGRSEVVYTLTSTCRPGPVARVLEPVALAAFRWETRRRLRALAAHLGARDRGRPGGGQQQFAVCADTDHRRALNHSSIAADRCSNPLRGAPTMSTPALSHATNTNADVQRNHNEGHGRRLTAAFEALEAFPALAESRNRLLRVVSEERPSTSDVVNAVESDVALVISVLRLANQVEGKTRGRVESVVQAVDLLSPEAVQALATRARTFDFFERSAVWDAAPERFRLHGVATQRAADRLATEAGYEHRDRLMVTALLHDIGKLVLMHAYPGYPNQVHGDARTPEERIHRERRELGVDHALVGGVLARRWGMPKQVASVIERHHSDDATGEAAFVRLADMLAHYAQGGQVSPTELLKTARVIGLGPTELRRVMYDLPYPVKGRARQVDPCPLSTREVEVLRRLAEGKVYKQIALELSLSTSTVRTHLHNVYGKLGAVDRAQAVLMATERGWL